MKTILIILAILVGLALFGLLFPAMIAVGLAWVFFSLDMTVAGVICVIVGLITEIGYLYAVFSGAIDGEGRSSYDSAHDRSGSWRSDLGWPGTLTAIHVINKMKDKE